ncbi:SDR family NAD(P)-dependent oxidoreductase [Amphibiibacter pelophylacis]|uniref:SDR family NAD(P)-dependent oxidoreductase n=1 Tax=Amphibiibacter pelophylacis TaxID=1799477 RepID=A0ACC6P0T5_9BURK
MNETRVFLISGAASGLGLATAERALTEGHRVMLADIAAEAGQAQAERLAQQYGDRVAFHALDVTDASQAQAAVAATVARFGRLSHAVNCAGVAPAEKVVGKEGAHDLARFARTVNINLVGTFNVLRCAAEAMARNAPDAHGERGLIVNTASVAAFDGQVGQAAYAASKAGVAGLALPVARELARHAIRVMTIAPGIFMTPMVQGMPQNVQDALAASIPFPQRLGQAHEYADLVMHLCENRYLNAETIRLDGAVRMNAR